MQGLKAPNALQHDARTITTGEFAGDDLLGSEVLHEVSDLLDWEGVETENRMGFSAIVMSFHLLPTSRHATGRDSGSLARGRLRRSDLNGLTAGVT
jgi:hypothetical protein